jgi:hypothetical protein
MALLFISTLNDAVKRCNYLSKQTAVKWEVSILKFSSSIYSYVFVRTVGRYSSVSIVTTYGLDGPGIESWRGARFSAPVQTGPGTHHTSCTMDTWSFPGVKVAGADADHPPPSNAEVMKE